MQFPSRSSVPTAATCLVLATFLDLVMLFGSVAATQNHYIHWNTTNPIFRISNTDHIIDVNKGNNLFEYDQVTIICPNYDPNTDEDDAEKYIIYNVSREEYDTCRITDPNPRIIAVCDKPYKLMFFTITFRSFTPQPGGLEFRPGQDYYFISTSSSGDMLRRIGGRCSTHNMKVVFKVCCNETEKHLIQQDKPHLLHPEAPPMLPDYSVSPSPPTPSAPPRGGWRPVGHPTASTARPAILHSYKGVQDLYDLHVPSINVKATTKKAEEYKNKNKHPNNIAKNEGLTSAAASPTARGTCSWRTCTLTTWCTSFVVFLLVRIISR